MKKISLFLLLTTLILTTACSGNNDKQSGAAKPTKNERTNQISMKKVVSRDGQDIGLNIQEVRTTDSVNEEDLVPSEPDMEREEKVINLVNESEKYVGKKMSNAQLIDKVFSSIGYQGVVLQAVPPHDGRDLANKIQPGDILYFDTDGDQKADDFAIKLGNGEIIHAKNGTIQITDIHKSPNQIENLIHVQRVF